MGLQQIVGNCGQHGKSVVWGRESICPWGATEVKIWKLELGSPLNFQSQMWTENALDWSVRAPAPQAYLYGLSNSSFILTTVSSKSNEFRILCCTWVPSESSHNGLQYVCLSFSHCLRNLSSWVPAERQGRVVVRMTCTLKQQRCSWRTWLKVTISVQIARLLSSNRIQWLKWDCPESPPVTESSNLK